MFRSTRSARPTGGPAGRARGSSSIDDDVVQLSPAIVATSIGGAPMPVDDSRTPDQDGATAPGLLREEVRAAELGAATDHQVRGDHLAGGLLDSGGGAFVVARTTADAEAATWESQRALRRRIQREADEVDEQIQALEHHADCTIAAKRQAISTWGKPLMIAGDTSIFAGILYLGGSPLALAVLAGVSTATSLVATGSTWGKAEKFAEDRVRRGPLPAGAPRQLGGLFERGSAATVGRNVWRVLAASVALAVFVAFMVLGQAVGDPGGKALAIGLLAAITVAGSAALEAYGANEAADLLHQLIGRRTDVTARLVSLLAPSTRHAAAAQRAHTLGVAIGHLADGAGITTRVIADRSPETPSIAGYLARPGQELPAPAAHTALAALATIAFDEAPVVLPADPAPMSAGPPAPSTADAPRVAPVPVAPVRPDPVPAAPVPMASITFPAPTVPFAAPATVAWPASAPSVVNGVPTSVSSS